MTMSDGVASMRNTSLVPHPVAVLIFSVVVNKDTRVHELSTGQIQGIFAGTFVNWNQLGGADIPISIVSRDSRSGSRKAFEERVLKSVEPAISSYDCVNKLANSNAPFVRCEWGSTSKQLEEVNRIPGAIGYADVSEVAAFDRVDKVQLDRTDSEIEQVMKGRYPYWAVEYLYTYGRPDPRSLLSSFLMYMSSDAVATILRSERIPPCRDRQQNLTDTLCASDLGG